MSDEMRRSVPRTSKFRSGCKGEPFAVRQTTSFMMAVLLLFSGLWSGWGAETVRADGADIILFVKMDGDDGKNGTNWDDAFATLQKALDTADTSGGQKYEIWIAKGTYVPTKGMPIGPGGSCPVSGPPGDPRSGPPGDPCSGNTAQLELQTTHFEMKNGVAIYGGFAGFENPANFSLADRDFAVNETILSGFHGNDNFPSSHVFYHFNLALNATAVLDGVTITGGNATGVSEDGGGMYNYNSSPALTNVTIRGNYANNNGGGMYNQNNSNPTLTHVTISGNSGRRGGGMSNVASSPTLTNVIISDNQGSGVEGGGMSNWDNSSPTLTNVTISGNVASLGGGMYNNQSSPTLTNVTVIGNQARAAGGGMGGGLYNFYCSLAALTNVTISGNWAGVEGGGMYNNESSTTIRNSIIWGNSATDTYRPNIVFAPYWSTSLSISYSLIEGSDGSDHNIDADPRFLDPKPGSGAPTTSGDYRLQKDSPAINAGNNSDIPSGVTTDLDGNIRVAGASVDLGAYEFQPPAAPANLGGTSGDGKVTLTWNAATGADSYIVYKYEGAAAPADPDEWTEVATSVTDATYVVTELTNGTSYVFAVKAVNLGGASGFSSEVAAKPRTVPAAPTGVSTTGENGQAEVSFTVPTSDGGSAITGYTVTARVDGDATTITATGASSPITVTGLTYGTAYTFTVHATNALGDSPESGPSDSVIPRTAPDAPTGVSATAENGQAEVNFTAPTNTGGSTITGYTVTAWADGHATDITATGATSPITVTGVTNGTAYTFTVHATNAAGDSPESNPSAPATPLPPAPAAPANLSGTSGDAKVNLTWNIVPAASRYTVYKYEGTAAPADPGDWTKTAASVTGATYMVTGLINGTSYAFAVKAANLGGESSFSATAVVTPTTALPPVTDPASEPDPELEPAAPTGSGKEGLVGPVISTNGTITIPVGRSGEVNQDGAISVMIPGGAADRELRITIAKVPNTQDLLSDGETLVSDIYELLKNSPETFNKPVTLTFALDPSVAGSQQTIAVFYYDETEKKWIKIGGEISGNNIRVEVNHFTKFAVFAVDEAATAPDQDEIAFSDISEHWAKDSIMQAVLDGIIEGYPDGTFRPNEPVSRAEFTVMLAHALKLDGTGATLPFTDRDKIGAWAEEAIARAVLAGIVNGYEDGRFQPNAPLTRTEMAIMIARSLQLPTGSTSQTGFSDDDRIPGWAKSAVEELRRLGIISGRGDGKYVPNDKATRAETVVTLLRMLKSSGQN